MSYTVVSNGDCINVHSKRHCVATFGPLGLVINTTDHWRPLPNRVGKPSMADWEMFKLEVTRLFGVDLSEDYQPEWMTEG